MNWIRTHQSLHPGLGPLRRWLAVALAVGLAFGFPPMLAVAGDRGPVRAGDADSSEPAPRFRFRSREARPPDTSPLGVFRSSIGEYRRLGWKIEEAEARKSDLERRLEERKAAASSSMVVDRYLRDREVESLQRELHVAISELVGLRRSQSALFDKILESAPTWREEFVRLRKPIDDNPRENRTPDRGLSGRRGGPPFSEAEELDRSIAALEALIRNPDRPNAALDRLFFRDRPGNPDGLERHPEEGARGPRHRMAVGPIIWKLEREQEMLLKRWQLNEAQLRRLRQLDESLRDGDPLTTEDSWVEERRSAANLPAPLLRPSLPGGEAVPVGGRGADPPRSRR